MKDLNSTNRFCSPGLTAIVLFQGICEKSPNSGCINILN